MVKICDAGKLWDRRIGKVLNRNKKSITNTILEVSYQIQDESK